MPIYEYRCSNGHNFEVRQSFSDGPVTVCQECGATVERVFRPVAVHFKGSGFYNTDYGTRKRSREMKESAESGSGKSDSSSEKKGSDSSSDSSSSKSDSSSSGSNSGSSGSSSGSSSSGSSEKSSSKS